MQRPWSEGALLFVKVSDHKEGKDEMTKASIDLQDLRRRLYVKAKAETSWRFWGLYVHVCKMETLSEAYALAKKNDGAPGSDGVTFFEAIEAQGVEAFLEQIADELVGRSYAPLPARRVVAGNPEGWRARSGRGLFDSSRSATGVAQGALKLHIGTNLRGGLPTGVVFLDTDRNGQLMKRSTGWRRQLFSTRHAL